MGKFQTEKLPRSYERIDEGDFIRLAGVPIFAEHVRAFRDKKTGKVKRVPITGTDLNAMAAAINRRAEQDNYFSAAHPEHHDKEGSDAKLAFLANAEVKTYQFEGGPREVLLADLLVDSEDDLTEIKKFPYRSVEVHLGKKEIQSLALMKSEAPYHKFPIFQVRGEEKDYLKHLRMNRSESFSDGEALAYALSGDHYVAQYCWKIQTTDTDSLDDEAASYMDQDMKGQSKTCPEDTEDMDESGDSAMDEKTKAEIKKIVLSTMTEALPKVLAETIVDPVAMARDEAGKKYASRDWAEGALSGLETRIQQIEEVAQSNASRNEKNDLYRECKERLGRRTLPAKYDETFHAKYDARGADSVRDWIDGLMLTPEPPASDAEDTPESADVHAYNNDAERDVCEKYRSNPTQYQKAYAAVLEYRAFSPYARRQFTVEDHVEMEVSGAY